MHTELNVEPDPTESQTTSTPLVLPKETKWPKQSSKGEKSPKICSGKPEECGCELVRVCGEYLCTCVIAAIVRTSYSRG